MDIPRMPHYERLLIVPISKAFQYYRDIEAYTERYPDYCKRVDIIEKSENSNMIKTKEFWNTSIDNDIDKYIRKDNSARNVSEVICRLQERKRVFKEMDTKGKSLSGNVIDVTSNMKEPIFKQVMAQIFLIGIAAE
jgi:hypothetical protein